MPKKSIILAVDKNGEEINVETVQKWINLKNKNKLSSFLYNRLYSRYIKPFDFKNDDFQSNYKSGFAIMASCCLMIETFVSFREPLFRDTNYKSERCFGWYFLTQSRFNGLSKNGLTLEEYKTIVPKQRLRNKGIPKDFYKNVRCGILHNGETKNSWLITRNKNDDFFNEKQKKINATKFLNRLKYDSKDFKVELENAEMDEIIWETYLNRLQDIISKS